MSCPLRVEYPGAVYHLLVETPQADFSRGMRRLNGVFTQDFNRIHQRTRSMIDLIIQDLTPMLLDPDAADKPILAAACAGSMVFYPGFQSHSSANKVNDRPDNSRPDPDAAGKIRETMSPGKRSKKMLSGWAGARQAGYVKGKN